MQQVSLLFADGAKCPAWDIVPHPLIQALIELKEKNNNSSEIRFFLFLAHSVLLPCDVGLGRRKTKTKSSSGISTVRIVIGIFQKKEEVIKFQKHRMLDSTSLTEVGPFFSKGQAYAWMKELHGQIDNSEVAYTPEREDENLKWYGFTFEE